MPRQTAPMDTNELKLRWLETGHDADLKAWLDAELDVSGERLLAESPSALYGSRCDAGDRVRRRSDDH